ncbi:VanZ family protein [Listeria innocua]|uniref:VanZ family protein n=1 Tax=Listeria innocua TaxID=1642 RepID=UPI0010D99EE4|nr:VanZ family protein [Listeria innocua]EGH2217665.1 VanZ family protein [Listeria monocytogenes]EED2112315.1 VanZ family protein [Listeria innocua]EHY9115201.1 VanZ family protein [Listeria innocua]EHY9118075.1 VanZ family protein [Listeria innocua]EHY9120878.1 VanZ family protein [Listeria innocua]
MTTIPTSLPITLIIICFYEIVYLFIKIFIKKSKFNKKKSFVDIVFVAYLAILTEVVLLPLNIITLSELKEAFPLEAYLQLIPFKTVIFYINNIINIHIMIQFFGNLFLLVPLAVYMNLNRSISISNNLIIVLCISLFIEVIQGILNLVTQYPNNVSDIDDIILNVVGYMCTLLVIPWLKKEYHSFLK